MAFHIKLLINLKPLQIIFFEIDGLIRIFDGARYLTWFGFESFDAVWKVSDKPKKWHRISFSSLFCKNQSWF